MAEAGLVCVGPGSIGDLAAAYDDSRAGARRWSNNGAGCGHLGASAGIAADGMAEIGGDGSGLAGGTGRFETGGGDSRCACRRGGQECARGSKGIFADQGESSDLEIVESICGEGEQDR